MYTHFAHHYTSFIYLNSTIMADTTGNRVGKPIRTKRKSHRRLPMSYLNSPESLVNRVKQRNELLQTSTRKITDLVGVEIDLSSLTIDAHIPRPVEEAVPFNVRLSIGFMEFDESLLVGDIQMDYDWFEDRETLHEHVLTSCLEKLSRLGVQNLCRVYGCEVQYSQGYSSIQGTVEPAGFAIVSTKEAIKAWVNQPTKQIWSRSMTVRLVRLDGSKFHQGYRTWEEKMVEKQLERAQTAVAEALHNITLSDFKAGDTNASEVRSTRDTKKMSKGLRNMLRGRAQAGLLTAKDRRRLSEIPELSLHATMLAPRSVSLPAADIPDGMLSPSRATGDVVVSSEEDVTMEGMNGL